MTAIFTYGSLMFADVWSRVVRGDYHQVAAILPGYRRHRIHNETFPAVIKGHMTNQVSGILYLDIDSDDLARLDEFEGDYYRRETVDVISAENIIRAETYILRDEFIHLLDECGWDAAEFAQQHLAAFLKHYL